MRINPNFYKIKSHLRISHRKSNIFWKTTVELDTIHIFCCTDEFRVKKRV